MPDTIADVLVRVGDEGLLAGRLWSHRRRNTSRRRSPMTPATSPTPTPMRSTRVCRLRRASSRPRPAAQSWVFSDCAPDRWGRRLVNRAEEHRVRDEGGGAERSFGEADYLLRVRDDLRQGALRFRDPERPTFSMEMAGSPSRSFPVRRPTNGTSCAGSG